MKIGFSWMKFKHCFVGRPIALLLGLFLITFFPTDSTHRTSANQSRTDAVKYTVISQRWLTDEELKKFDDVIGYRIAVRLSLTNESKDDVEYLASSHSDRPLGYRWHRKIGTTNWAFSPPSRTRADAPESGFAGISRWLTLPPNRAVELEVLIYKAKDEEFVFSTFVRKNSTSEAREIMTVVTKPLSDN